MGNRWIRVLLSSQGARGYGFRTAKAYQVACLNKEGQLDVIGVDHVGINLQL